MEGLREILRLVLLRLLHLWPLFLGQEVVFLVLLYTLILVALEHVHEGVVSVGDLSIRIAALLLNYLLDGTILPVLRHGLLKCYEGLGEDVFDEVCRCFEEGFVSVHVQAPVDQICKLVSAVEFEVRPFFKNNCFSHGADPQHVQFITLRKDDLVVGLIQFENKEDSIDVIRLLHLLEGELFLVGAKEEIARLGLIQEHIFEYAQKAMELESLLLLSRVPIALQRQLHFRPQRRIYTELQILHPLLVLVRIGASHYEHSVRPEDLQVDPPLVIVELVGDVHLLEVQYSLWRLVVVALLLVLVVS